MCKDEVSFIYLGNIGYVLGMDVVMGYMRGSCNRGFCWIFVCFVGEGRMFCFRLNSYLLLVLFIVIIMIFI